MSTHPAEIGDSIRARRRAAGLTLDELSAQAGVSPTMLSEVERSVKNPTVKLAYQIARALGCSITDLMEAEDAQATTVTRSDDRRRLLDPESGVERLGLSSDLPSQTLEAVHYSLPPKSSAGEMAANREGIVEHITVLAGILTLVLGGETQVLRAGDGVTYGPQKTTEYRNEHGRNCDFVLLSDSSRCGGRPA